MTETSAENSDALQQHFDETIARDRRIEPRDWMPTATAGR